MPVKTDFDPLARGIPIGFANDFGNGLSPAECDIVMRGIYEDRGVPYEAPTWVNDVDGFSITDGAFHVRQLARNRPDRDMVLVAVVDPGVGTSRRGVVINTEEGHTFIGPDNGVFGPALAEETVRDAFAFRQEVFDAASNTFHGRDVFAPTAARVATGEKASEMSDLLLPIDASTLTRMEFSPNTVVHVDGYGDKPGRPDYGGNVKFELSDIPTNEWGDRATSARLTLPRRSRGLIGRTELTAPVRKTFGEAGRREFLLYQGSSGGGVELAVNGGKDRHSAAGKLRLFVGDRVGFDWNLPGQNGAQGKVPAGGRAR